ncbi:MAG TPA: FtsQ-type POTRA domain-containing protein [Candidatus Paceibacterota bacterium]|nr:FtsQ-type POTRA domain-containing protein [Candidatus Paceibacterota bacterium]
MGRTQVLDVKVRSSIAAAARTRMIAASLGIIFGTVIGLYALWQGGRWALDRLVYENKSFAIQQIDVETDGVISPEQLRRWCAVKPGENLLALDLSSVKRDLESYPIIQSVSIERILPGTLRVRVTEREPVAQITVPRPKASGDGIELSVFQLDGDGFVMLPLDPRQRAVPLAGADDQMPVISGVNFAELQPGRRMDSVPMQAALKLIQEFESSPMAGLVDLKRIDISSPQVLIVTTAQGSEVTFGMNDFETQLQHWQQVHVECLRYSRSIATLDLAVGENVPLRMQEASAAAPAPKKTLRVRRKNV